MYYTHLLVGIFVSVLAIKLFELSHPLWFVIAVLFGSIFVDIDETQSFIGRRTKPLSWIIKALFGHRGLFHSVFMAAAIAYGWYYFIGIEVALGFLAGYVGHLLSDGITQGGVRIFYPLSTYEIRGFVRVGGMFEAFLFIGIAIVTLILII